MIKNILDLLSLDDFYGISKNIDIAKGINKKTSNPKQMLKKELRKKRALNGKV